MDSEGCVQVDGLAQLPASEPSELLQILRKGLAQPPGPSHLGLGRNFRWVCVCFFLGGIWISYHICHDVMIEGLFQIGPSRIHQHGMLVVFFPDESRSFNTIHGKRKSNKGVRQHIDGSIL